MLNLLVDDLPKSVLIDGVEHPINWDAKTMIRISILIENNPNASADETVAAGVAMAQLSLFYPVVPDNLRAAMEQLIAFYTWSPRSYEGKNTSRESGNEKRYYSFQYDAHLIYAAFLQQYPGKTFDSLHWFEFQALLEGLTEDCMFVKVVQYRGMKISSNMSKQEKQFYNKMKRLYALPDHRSQDEKDQDFAKMLFCL